MSTNPFISKIILIKRDLSEELYTAYSAFIQSHLDLNEDISQKLIEGRLEKETILDIVQIPNEDGSERPGICPRNNVGLLITVTDVRDPKKTLHMFVANNVSISRANKTFTFHLGRISRLGQDNEDGVRTCRGSVPTEKEIAERIASIDPHSKH